MKKKYYCIEKDCDKEVCYETFKYGLGRCKSCAKKGKLNSKYKGKIKIICSVCEKNIERCPSRINKHNFCSKDCKNKFHSIFMTGKKFPQNSGENNACKRLEVREKISKKIRGKNHWNYIDGRSNLDYPEEYTSHLRQKIRKRDNYTCQNCGIIEEEYIIIYGKILDIHHIDYNKFNNKEDNLITLCHQCNVRANFNRDYWINFYKNKIWSIKI